MNLFTSSSTFIESVNQYLIDFGLEGSFGQIFVALVIIAGIAVALTYLKMPRIFILLSIIVGLMMFVSFGWFPSWLIFVIMIAIFGLFMLRLKGGLA